ncbi:hypothetical protein E5D57_010957 [Metarhizium anisopliae]|nr:hypothetical protein E5D57_010957 [Metarhizium anisopliae]
MGTTSALEDVAHVMLALMIQSAQSAAAGQTKGQLLIGGQSLTDIVEGFKYSDDEVAQLGEHIAQYRPRLAVLLPSIEPAFALLYPWAKVVETTKVDELVGRALVAENADAALDNSIWASLEWKWVKTGE